MPARPRKPKDKAKVEGGVQIVQRWILARLRDMEFFSLGELNAYISKLLKQLNDTPFQKLPGSRRSEFERVDKPALRPLPPHSYSYKEIKRAKVNIDYHTEYRKTRYSVPHNYIGERVEVCADTNIVEVYFREKLIAQHCRADRGGFVTDIAHMPEAHQRREKWNEERIRSWAAQQGAEVLKWVNGQFCSRKHPAQAYRVCLGLLNLSRSYPKRLNDACGVANRNGLLRLKVDCVRPWTQRVSQGRKGSLLQDLEAVSFPRAGQGRRKLQKASGSAWENGASDHRRLGS